MISADESPAIPGSDSGAFEEQLNRTNSKLSTLGRSVDTGVRAVQIAFEMEQRIASAIRVQAAQEGLTPSDRIRKIIGLPYAPPKRPRLTLSLSEEDYASLAVRYALPAEERMLIKKRIAEELASATE